MQNVRIWWNSIYDMLFKTLYLRFQIHAFLHQESNVKLQSLKLSLIEWKYICYLIYVLKLFKTWTMIVFQTNIVNITQIWMIFNDIFNITETFTTDLESRTNTDRVLQKLVSAIGKTREKLAIYYGKTVDEFGWMYNFACVLDPDQKLKVYDGVEWSDDRNDITNDLRYFKSKYKSKFMRYYREHYKRYETQVSFQETESEFSSQICWISVIYLCNLFKLFFIFY